VNGSRFDEISKALASATSRRGALKALGAALLGVFVARPTLQATPAAAVQCSPACPPHRSA